MPRRLLVPGPALLFAALPLRAADAPAVTARGVAAADGFCEAPTLSADGRRLYFHRLVDGRFRIFESER